jgi:hypothetical protein
MSKIEDLIAAPIEVTFRGDKYLVDEFTIEETPILAKAFSQNAEEKLVGLKELLKLVAKRLFPTATDKDIAKIGAKYLDDLMNVLMQINQVKDSEKEELEEAKKRLLNK